MNKKVWFGFNIFVLMFSSIMLFLFCIIAIASSAMSIPGISKEIMLVGLFAGNVIGTIMIVFAVGTLWKMKI